MFTIISLILTLIPSTFLLVFLLRLANWANLTFLSSKSGALDLSAYGGSGRSKRAWALITGASDGIGAAFAKVQNYKFFYKFFTFVLGVGQTKVQFNFNW